MDYLDFLTSLFTYFKEVVEFFIFVMKGDKEAVFPEFNFDFG